MNQLKRFHLIVALFGATCTLVTSLVHAAILPLESRLGGLAYYDPNLNITWAADANINGADTWSNQNTWVSGLIIDGVSGWRLPNANLDGDATVVDCTGGGVTGCIDNEMGYLFWEEGVSSVTPSPFINIQSTSSLNFYWSSTIGASTANAWALSFVDGTQTFGSQSFPIFALAVHDGDVSAVPVPAAIWLFGSGLIGLIGVARRSAHI